MALAFDPAADLAGVIVSIRTDWTREAVYAALRADDRPWRTVVLGSTRGAGLEGPDRVRHPHGLRYVNPDGPTAAAQSYPTVAEALEPELCAHEFRVGACPFCRTERP